MSSEVHANNKKNRATPVVSRVLRSGYLAEMLFDREDGTTAFARSGAAEPDVVDSFEEDGQMFVPYSPRNNLLTHRVLLLPSAIGARVEQSRLLASIRAFIHRYVDLSDAFEEVAAHYVLLTWLYDKWNELPYLRVRGEYGSGKSRFLLTVGSICWKPIFASGASTVSPIFRLLDEVGGTLVIDEADFWQSDEKAEIVKILNNGSARGFPVLRTDMNSAKEFSPRAFNIFGPKIIATRHGFEDEALESRCLSEVLGARAPRADIPVSLPASFDREAEDLRNQLVRFRLDSWSDTDVTPVRPTCAMSPRRAQVIAPMLGITEDLGARHRLSVFASGVSSAVSYLLSRATLQAMATVLAIGRELSVGAIAQEVNAVGPHLYTDRQVGVSIRDLGLSTRKRHGVYCIPREEIPLLRTLLTRHGVVDVGDVGDPFPPQPAAPALGDDQAESDEQDGRIGSPTSPTSTGA